MPPKSAEELAVLVDTQLLATNPERLTLDLPDGRIIEAVRNHWIWRSADRFAWYGNVRDANGAWRTPRAAASGGRGDYVVLSFIEDRVVGTIRTPDGEIFRIKPGDGGVHRVARVTSDEPAGCGVEGARHLASTAIATRQGDACFPLKVLYRIDLLVLYMPELVGPGEQAVQDFINHQVALANMIFMNSGVGIEYDLVYVGPLTEGHPIHQFGQVDVFDALHWLNNTVGATLQGQPEVIRLRNDYGADMVSLMIPSNTTSSACGVANLPHLSGTTEVLQGTSIPFTDQAYMAFQYQCGEDDFTFGHEHGHSLGMQHEYEDSNASRTPVKPYAYGYRFDDSTNKGATVMGCDKAGNINAQSVCNRIAFFSNPNLSSTVTGIGVPIGKSTSENPGAFNACVANARAARYAGFRSHPTDGMPVVQITSPVANSTVSQSTLFTLAATATDPENGNLANLVQWRSDVAGNLGVGSPISVQLSTLGDHLITASVRDGAGKTAQHTIRVTVVETDPPVEYIDRPRYRESTAGDFLVQGWATDASGVQSVTFQVDSKAVNLSGYTYGHYRSDVCTAYPDLHDPNCPYVGWSGTLDTRAFSNGYHYLYATAKDIHGNTKVYNRLFSVNNTDTVSFEAIADSWVWQLSPYSNYGSSGSLYVRSAATGQGRHTYLKFSVSGITRPVQSAKLRIHTGSSAFSASRVYWIKDTSWGESTINWVNASLDFFLQYPTYQLPANSWVELDVSSIVSGNSTYTIGLVGPDEAGLWYYSRETQYKPSLIVTY